MLLRAPRLSAAHVVDTQCGCLFVAADCTSLVDRQQGRDPGDYTSRWPVGEEARTVQAVSASHRVTDVLETGVAALVAARAAAIADASRRGRDIQVAELVGAPRLTHALSVTLAYAFEPAADSPTSDAGAGAGAGDKPPVGVRGSATSAIAGAIGALLHECARPQRDDDTEGADGRCVCRLGVRG